MTELVDVVVQFWNWTYCAQTTITTTTPKCYGINRKGLLLQRPSVRAIWTSMKTMVCCWLASPKGKHSAKKKYVLIESYGWMNGWMDKWMFRTYERPRWNGLWWRGKQTPFKNNTTSTTVAVNVEVAKNNNCDFSPVRCGDAVRSVWLNLHKY